MKVAKKKKRRARASKSPGSGRPGDGDDKNQKALSSLVEAFGSVSLDEAKAAFREAGGDVNEAACVLGANTVSDAEDRSAYSFSSGVSVVGSTSASSDGSCEVNVLKNSALNAKCVSRKSKQKRVAAATGTVSTVLGKDYVKASPRRNSGKQNGSFGPLEEEEAEQFLCSMLGDDSELGMGVVRDVLCQCRYNVEKALDVLLDLSALSSEQGNDRKYIDNGVSSIGSTGFLHKYSDILKDRASSDYTPQLSRSDFQEDLWSINNASRLFPMWQDGHSLCSPRNTVSDLPQKILESLFHVPKSSEHEPDSMNWRNVVKKMETLGNDFDDYATRSLEPEQKTYVATGGEYHTLRKEAAQHWDSMKSYYQRAATAYARGEREHAAYLSEQGRLQTKLARVADERASHAIFKARNRGITNVITIDFHGQHVKQALRLLKLHLLFGIYVPSVQTLRVITGCGTHGVGKSKLKQSVIKLLEREGVEWREENQGTLLIKLDGYREFSFLGSESDVD